MLIVVCTMLCTIESGRMKADSYNEQANFSRKGQKCVENWVEYHRI